MEKHTATLYHATHDCTTITARRTTDQNKRRQRHLLTTKLTNLTIAQQDLAAFVYLNLSLLQPVLFV